jgi:hypothetical protein
LIFKTTTSSAVVITSAEPKASSRPKVFKPFPTFPVTRGIFGQAESPKKLPPRTLPFVGGIAKDPGRNVVSFWVSLQY